MRMAQFPSTSEHPPLAMTTTTTIQTQTKRKRKRADPPASLFGMEPSLSMKEQQHLALLMKHYRPELGVLAAQKYAEAREAYDRETEALVAPMFEPVPEPLLLPPLTSDIVKYIVKLITDLQDLDHKPNLKMILHVIKGHNAQVSMDNDLDDPDGLQLDGYIFLKMLQRRLPPCVLDKEHVVAFFRWLAQKRKAFLERKFRDEMVDKMLDMCEPLHELF